MKQLLCLASLLCCISCPALAQGKVIVLEFEGPRAGQLRENLYDLLKEDDFELTDAQDAEQLANELSVDLGSQRGRVTIAQAAEAAAFIGGLVTRRKKRLELAVRVYNGHDGDEVGVVEVRGRPAVLRKRLQTRLLPQLRELLAQTRPPEPSVEESNDDQAVEQERAPQDTRMRPEPPPPATDDMVKHPESLVLGVYASLWSRSFTYKDAVLPLSKHKILLNLAPAISAAFFPLALFDEGVLAHLGFDLRFRYLLFASSLRDGQRYPTHSLDLQLGLRARLPLGKHQLALGIAYGVQSTNFDSAQDGSTAGVPNVRYEHVRAGTDARLMVDTVAIQPALALLVPVSLGQLASRQWFPHATALGLEASLHLAIPMGASLEIVAGGSFRQWGMSLNPKPEDSSVTMLWRAAGGATDRYIIGDIGLVLRI